MRSAFSLSTVLQPGRLAPVGLGMLLTLTFMGAERTLAVEGVAEFRRGSLHISADRLTYDYAQDMALARGNVRLSKDGNVFSGPELKLNSQRFEGYFLGPNYYFSRTDAGGSAKRVDFLGTDRVRATKATYTSCPRDGVSRPAWILTTDEVELDFEANQGVAKGAVVRFLGVPILAAPVLSFPLTDARKSGWLPPSLNLDNKSGFQVAVPYYWNIARNRDATLTPTTSARRGAGVNTEYRYLESRHSGRVNLNLLPDDHVAKRLRYALDVTHETVLPGGWVGHVLGQQVSDDGYWKDFPRGVSSLTPRLLPTDFQARRRFTWGGGDGVSYLRVQRWQVLQETDPASAIEAPYERLPQIGVRARHRLDSGWVFEVESEFNRFATPSRVSVEAAGDTRSIRSGRRVHTLGSLTGSYVSAGWSLTPRMGFNVASYSFDSALSSRSTASRFIPTLSLNSAWTLERDSQWFGRATRQTLEPHLLYVYTPFREQTDLPNFDASAKDFNFESIYTANAFAGVDRVSDANQLTAGLTTRILDNATGAEALRLGVVQRFLFTDQRLTPDRVPLKQRFSDVLLLGSTQLVPRWTFDGAVQYSPETSRSVRSRVGARYSPQPFRTVNATYRLARGLSEHVEMGWQWALAGEAMPGLEARRSDPAVSAHSGGCKGRWYSVGRFNFNKKEGRITDSVLGLEYDSGCWIGRIVSERLSTASSDATTRLLLQLEWVGLSRIGSNPLTVLKDNIPGYRLLRDSRTAPTP